MRSSSNRRGTNKIIMGLVLELEQHLRSDFWWHSFRKKIIRNTSSRNQQIKQRTPSMSCWNSSVEDIVKRGRVLMPVDWENIIKNLEASLCYKLLDRFTSDRNININFNFGCFTIVWLVLFLGVYTSDVTFVATRFPQTFLSGVESGVICDRPSIVLDFFSSGFDRCSHSQFLRFWSVWIKTFHPLLLGTWFLTYFFVITWIFDEFTIQRLLNSLKSIQM